MSYLPTLKDTSFLTVSGSAALTSERTAAVGNNLSFTDGGANGSATFQGNKASTISGNTTLTGTSNTSQYSDATSAGFTVTLPAASSNTDKVILVKKIDSSANAVTVSRAGSDTIEGATTFALANQYDWVVIQSDGTATWKIIGKTVTSSGWTLQSSQTGTWSNSGVDRSIYPVDTTSAVTLNLVAATGTLKTHRIYITAGTNILTINRNGSDIILTPWNKSLTTRTMSNGMGVLDLQDVASGIWREV